MNRMDSTGCMEAARLQVRVLIENNNGIVQNCSIFLVFCRQYSDTAM